MKKIILLMAFAVGLLTAINSNAQLRTRVVPTVNLGNYTSLGVYPNTITGLGTADTLAVSDTIAYIIPFNGIYRFTPFLSFGWTKIGAGTATVTATFYQGNSPYNFSAVKAGNLNTTYSKTFTLSSSSTNFVDFLADSAKISGRYLKVQYVTSSTANVQGSIVTVCNTAMH